MRRTLLLLAVLAILAGCLSAPERLPLQPTPENGQGLDYNEVVLRARLYAMAANEAFYVNSWDELDRAAGHLEKSAQHLAKATAAPAKQQDKLATHSAQLAKDATELRAAAKAKDVKRTNDILQRIHLKVRELRPEE